MTKSYFQPRLHHLGTLALLGTLILLNTCTSKTTEGGGVTPPPKLVGCRAASWHPEAFSFYGVPADVLSRAEKTDLDLYKHRVFLLVADPPLTLARTRRW